MVSIQLPQEYRTEEIFHVKPAISTNNVFAGITIPQNPGLATNNFNSAHQDSYCSESVGLSGPTSKTLKLIKQFNPYGFVSIQACNSKNQMIAASFFGKFFLIVYDSDCNILSATAYGQFSGTFAGGYFYLNADENAVVCTSSQLECYPTAYVEPKSDVYPLKPIWSSDDIVELVTGQSTGNSLYSAMPVWGQANLYWCLLAGEYNSGTVSSPAYISVVEIVPNGHGCVTTLMAKYAFTNQWNNNSFAVDEVAAYFVLNTMTSKTQSANHGTLQCFTYDNSSKKLTQKWVYQYENCGYLKTGQMNVGSGTTPTLTFDDSGAKCVSITDNAAPQMNVVVVDRSTGTLISKTPVFSKMRSCDEASLIGVKDKVFVENNFGHTLDYPFSQLVSNEPGMDLVTVNPAGKSAEVTWDNAYTTFFGMSMLARESGIIFAYSGAWYETTSSTSGPEYSIIAIDSFDGRIIWRIPVGRGLKYCHEYGGIYFNRTGTSIYVGANLYLVSIQEVDPKIAELLEDAERKFGNAGKKFTKMADLVGTARQKLSS